MPPASKVIMGIRSGAAASLALAEQLTVAEPQDEYLGGDALADVGDVHTVTRGVVTVVVVREEHGVAPLRQGGWRLRWELGSGTARVA
jgi:hypothetical protein